MGYCKLLFFFEKEYLSLMLSSKKICLLYSELNE